MSIQRRRKQLLREDQNISVPVSQQFRRQLLTLADSGVSHLSHTTFADTPLKVIMFTTGMHIVRGARYKPRWPGVETSRGRRPVEVGAA